MARAANFLPVFTAPPKYPHSPLSFVTLSAFLSSFTSRSFSNCHRCTQSSFSSKSRSQFVSHCSLPEDGESRGTVDLLTIPDHWLIPSTASQEAEWLRVSLHKWLDDEYCPEPTNVEISKVAAESYYRSLVQKKITDVGEILLIMATDLESISYQESFHGAFSSANAAISLIVERIEQG